MCLVRSRGSVFQKRQVSRVPPCFAGGPPPGGRGWQDLSRKVVYFQDSHPKIGFRRFFGPPSNPNSERTPPFFRSVFSSPISGTRRRSGIWRWPPPLNSRRFSPPSYHLTSSGFLRFFCFFSSFYPFLLAPGQPFVEWRLRLRFSDFLSRGLGPRPPRFFCFLFVNEHDPPPAALSRPVAGSPHRTIPLAAVVRFFFAPLFCQRV